MDIAVFAYRGPVTPLVQASIHSLRTHSNCRIVFYGDPAAAEAIGCPVTPLTGRWDGYRMTRRMQLATAVGEPDDHVLLLDNDMIFRSNPFAVFDRSMFDMCYTTRPFENPASPVNGGFSGFRVTPATQELWQFLIDQAEHPTWRAYNAHRKRLGRTTHEPAREKDWWTHQDLLCTMHDHPPPVRCRLFDAGPKYNWCPDSGGGRALTDDARRRFYDGLTDPSLVVIHYKELKDGFQPGHLVLE